MNAMTEQCDALTQQANSAKRYLEGLPTADEHAANLRTVSMLQGCGLVLPAVKVPF